jgi:hypothetical protein
MQKTGSFIAVLVIGMAIGFTLGYLWPKQVSIPQAPAEVAPETSVASIPIRWDAHPDGKEHFYEVVVAEQMSWQEAQRLAESKRYRGIQGQAASITSSQEQEFVLTVLQTYLGRSYTEAAVWIGGTKEAGQWRWVTGEPWGYTNWDPGQPSHSGPTDRNEYLLEMYWNYPSKADGTWNDHGDHCRRPAVLVEYAARR